MTTSRQDSPRANRAGHPCPAWCTTNHDELLVDGNPGFGYMDNHTSSYLDSGPHLGAVKVARSARKGTTEVRLYGPGLSLTPEEADALAQLLEDRHSLAGIASLIDELRSAAQIARDTDTPGETHDASVDIGSPEDGDYDNCEPTL